MKVSKISFLVYAIPPVNKGAQRYVRYVGVAPSTDSLIRFTLVVSCFGFNLCLFILAFIMCAVVCFVFVLFIFRLFVIAVFCVLLLCFVLFHFVLFVFVCVSLFLLFLAPVSHTR